MLVELEKVAMFPWSPRLAQVRIPFGRTAARWCGAQSAKPGKYLAFDGSQILLDLADPLPEGVAGTWVELFIEREKVALYPYEL